jgi:hypothetical protein
MPYNLTELRTQLVARGYHVIPNIAKMPAVKGWNTPDFVMRELFGPRADLSRWELRWPGAHTIGVRLDDMVVIDADIDDPLVATFMEAVQHFAPEIYATAPVRFGASPYKRAIFCRLADGEEPFRRLASHKYGEDGYCVEIFGGGRLKGDKCSRQFGIYGPHSYNADGSVAAEYSWDTDVMELREVNHADLPRITRAQCAAIVDAFDDIAAGSGWQRQAAGAPDPVAGTQRVYDIDEDATRFDLLDGDTVTYDDLVEGMRCSSSFWDGLPHANRSKCHVGWSPLHDCIMVYDYEAEAAHYPKQYAPPDPNAFAEQMAAILPEPPAEDAAPPRPDDKASMGDKVAWLLATRGYCEYTDRVIELYKPGDECQTRRIAFQFEFRSWYVTTIGPRGGKDNAYATSGWELNAARQSIAGVRMRPDRPFPTYVEEGATFKNTYRRPRHAGLGDIGVWHAFMAHLLPDQTEREWFCDWLAHKFRNPGIPGVAVIMVAANENGPVYGAGRGMLRDVLERLFNGAYVRTIDFDIFSGKSAQAAYTDWAAYSVLVTVSEAKDTAESGRWADRRATYERLKETVDPRPVERTFTVKGLPAFRALAFASYLIFSNNFDAIQLPPDDRRATVLRNGAKMTPAMAIELQAWMNQPGNIAEVARWLEARDLTRFDAYTPMPTATKTLMQELARSEIDEAFDKIRRTIGPHGLFTGELLKAAILAELDYVGEGAETQVKRKIRAAAKRVGEYRLTPQAGRHWIMGWRGAHVPVPTTEEEARTRVDHSRKLIEVLDQATGLGAQIIGLR